MRAGFDPGLNQLAQLFLRSRRRRATATRLPAPPDERIVRHVFDDLRHRLAAVAFAVLELNADLAKRPTFPSHLDRRQMPVLVSGHGRRRGGLEILQAMAEDEVPATTISRTEPTLSAKED